MLHFVAFDGNDLPGVLLDLHLPALTNLTLPLVLDGPSNDHARPLPINIMLDFILRHVDTLKVVSILNLYRYLSYNHDLNRRLKPWFDGDRGLYMRRKE